MVNSLQTSVQYSLVVRAELPSRPTGVSEVTTSIEETGGSVIALDVTRSGYDTLRIDITCAAKDSTHAQQVVDAIRQVPSVEIGKVSDRVFSAHLGGKICVESKVPIRNRDDLSMVYTPGVARVSQAIAEQPENARNLTIKRNTVAVVTDGSAVLGLGNIGALAAMPVMEGKAALFKRFADVDAFPICLDTQDTEEIIRTIQILAPAFAGINLEDIAAPRCFEIENRLREKLDIPVFHDDQHGTAIVVLAALQNALKVVGKNIKDIRAVVAGAGAAGTAVLKLMLAAGARDVVVSDGKGIINHERNNLRPSSIWIAQHTNPRQVSGSLGDALKDADVFIGVSAPNVLTERDVKSMAPQAIVFAMANPTPEIDPTLAIKHAAVVATGRSDFANQINNVLAFPGVFRGLLDARSANITEGMLMAAANALAGVVGDEELNPTYIIPSVFHPDVAKAVAGAIEKAADLVMA